MFVRKLILGAAAAALMAALAPTTTAHAEGSMTLPSLTYRTGAYAPNGTPFANGVRDYIALVNSKGGVNGVTIDLIECETGYKTDVGVECYEKLKGEGDTGALSCRGAYPSTDGGFGSNGTSTPSIRRT